MLHLVIVMGISAEQHRACVGLYHSALHTVCSGYSVKGVKREKSDKNRFDLRYVGFIGFVIYFYMLLYIFSMTLDIASHDLDNASDTLKLNYNHTAATPPLYSSNRIYYNLYFLIVLLTGYNTLANKLSREESTKLKSRNCISWFLYKKYSGGGTVTNKVFDLLSNGLTFFLCALNILLIIICNMSLVNPGPPRNRPISVFYNNIHGFINTKDLASQTPPLNMTKLHELHAYLYTHKPDVVILNETWLKKSILDNEILPD